MKTFFTFYSGFTYTLCVKPQMQAFSGRETIASVTSSFGFPDRGSYEWPDTEARDEKRIYDRITRCEDIGKHLYAGAGGIAYGVNCKKGS
jgi:hypothetical protein